MDTCGFKWQTGDEPVDVCIQPAGAGHGDRHVSADGSWILVSMSVPGTFGEPVEVPVAADYEVTDG